MPIYMDRHDVSEVVTAEHVAQLHQADLKVQDQFGCTGLTYWFDDKRRTAFCLIEAPNKQAITAMHNHAHGEIPHSIIEVDTGIVESFLGRIADPVKAGSSGLHIIDDPAFRTILAIALAHASPGKKATIPFTVLAKQLEEIIREILNEFEGSVVRSITGRMLVSFQSVSKAVDAALAIQVQCHKPAFENLALNMGLSAGVPVTNKQSIFEDSITLAQRICEIIPAQLVVSADVTELCSSDTLHSFNTAGKVVTLTHHEETFITQLMDFIESSWSDAALKVDDLSKPAGLSKSQLYRTLKSLTGKSPNTFLKDYRLAKALELLSKKNSNVSETAFQAGFSSPSYFSKCFQKKYGHTPSGHLPAETL